MAARGSWYGNGLLRMAGKHIDLVGDSLKFMLLTSSYTPSLAVDAVYSDISANEISGTGYTATGQAVSGNTSTLTAANSWGTSRAASTAYTLGQIVKPASGNGYLYRCTVPGTTGADVAPTAGTNASPIVVTATAHGLTTGNAITLASVTGNTNMNAASLALVLGANTYNLENPTTLALIAGNGTFGGSPTIVPTYPTVPGQSITDGTVTWTCIGSYAVKFTFTSPSWTTATITARYGVLYDTSDSNRLLAAYDFSSDITSTNGTFTATVDSIAGATDMFGGW